MRRARSKKLKSSKNNSSFDYEENADSDDKDITDNSLSGPSFEPGEYSFTCTSNPQVVFESEPVIEAGNGYKLLFIQMEYCEGNSLRSAIDGNLLTAEKDKWKLVIQILDVLDYIHSKFLIHRDLKPSNIFLSLHNEAKLGDFGLTTLSAKKSHLETYHFRTTKDYIPMKGGDLLSCGIGTRHYISPEQLTQNIYNHKSDMYSLGIIIFEMFYPFSTYMEREQALRKIYEKHEFPEDFATNTNLYKVVSKLTFSNPDHRPSARELLNSGLVPLYFNEEIIFENLNNILKEQDKYTKRFLETIIEKNLSVVANCQIRKKSNYCQKIEIINKIKNILYSRNYNEIILDQFERFDGKLKIIERNNNELEVLEVDSPINFEHFKAIDQFQRPISFNYLCTRSLLDFLIFENVTVGKFVSTSRSFKITPNGSKFSSADVLYLFMIIKRKYKSVTFPEYHVQEAAFLLDLLKVLMKTIKYDRLTITLNNSFILDEIFR